MMKDSSSSKTVTAPPKVQKLERLKTIEKEHKDALQKALSLNIPHAAVSAEDETPQDEAEPSQGENEDAATAKSKSSGGKTNWDQVVEKLFKKSESGDIVVERDIEAQAPAPPASAPDPPSS